MDAELERHDQLVMRTSESVMHYMQWDGEHETAKKWTRFLEQFLEPLGARLVKLNFSMSTWNGTVLAVGVTSRWGDFEPIELRRSDWIAFAVGGGRLLGVGRMLDSEARALTQGPVLVLGEKALTEGL